MQYKIKKPKNLEWWGFFFVLFFSFHQMVVFNIFNQICCVSSFGVTKTEWSETDRQADRDSAVKGSLTDDENCQCLPVITVRHMIRPQRQRDRRRLWNCSNQQSEQQNMRFQIRDSLSCREVALSCRPPWTTTFIFWNFIYRTQHNITYHSRLDLRVWKVWKVSEQELSWWLRYDKGFQILLLSLFIFIMYVYIIVVYTVEYMWKLFFTEGRQTWN